MINSVAKFIQEQSELIDSGDWAKIYQQLTETYASEKNEIGQFTDICIEAGLNPLENLSHVQDYMFYGSHQSKIILPATITHIGYESFAKCDKLAEVYIPNSVEVINSRAFALSGLDLLGLTISYDGTKVEWARIIKETFWDDKSQLTIKYLR